MDVNKKTSFDVIGTERVNNSLLLDENFVKLINETIEMIKYTVNIANKNVLWEYIKCEIRTVTIDFSIKKTFKGKRSQTIYRNSTT
jgi:predicted RNA methylase